MNIEKKNQWSYIQYNLLSYVSTKNKSAPFHFKQGLLFSRGHIFFVCHARLTWHSPDPVTLCTLTLIHTAGICDLSTSKLVSLTSLPSSSISFTMKSEYLKVGMTVYLNHILSLSFHVLVIKWKKNVHKPVLLIILHLYLYNKNNKSEIWRLSFLSKSCIWSPISPQTFAWW